MPCEGGKERTGGSIGFVRRLIGIRESTLGSPSPDTALCRRSGREGLSPATARGAEMWSKNAEDPQDFFDQLHTEGQIPGAALNYRAGNFVGFMLEVNSSSWLRWTATFGQIRHGQGPPSNDPAVQQFKPPLLGGLWPPTYLRPAPERYQPKLASILEWEWHVVLSVGPPPRGTWSHP